MATTILCPHCSRELEVEETELADPKTQLRCNRCYGVFGAGFARRPPAVTATPAPTAAGSPSPRTTGSRQTGSRQTGSRQTERGAANVRQSARGLRARERPGGRDDLEGTSFSWTSLAGAGLAAVLGAIIWVTVVLLTGGRYFWFPTVVGLMVGGGARMGRWRGAATGAVAAGWSLVSIVGAKIATRTLIGDLATEGLLEIFDLWDALFIAGAMAIAFGIGSGDSDLADVLGD